MIKWLPGALALLLIATASGATVNNVSINGTLYAQAYGAIGDAIFSTDGIHQPDGTTNGTTTFTSPTGGFTSNLVGADIFIVGAGTAGALYLATVSHVTNTTTLTMSSTPPTNITGTAAYIIGHDNTAALQQWLNALRGTTTSGINLISRPNISGYLPAGTYLHRGLNFGGAANVTITGAGHDAEAGSQLYGGSNFLCVAPGTTPTGCHDFTGAAAYTLRDLAFWNGGIQSQPQTAGVWNVMFARHPTAGFAISNVIDTVDFKSNGTYDVIIQNSEQNGWINDGFNANADVSTAIFATTNLSNTHSFLASPFYGSTVGAGQSCTLNRFSGGATQFSADGSGHAVVFEGGPGDWTFNDAYVRLNNATDDFISDNGVAASVFSVSFNNLRVEPDDAGTSNPTNHFINFSNASSVFNGGEMHNISWGEAATQAGPIITVNGNLSSMHTSNILMSNNPNPEVVMGAGGDDFFGNINAAWIQIAGQAVDPVVGDRAPFINSAVGSYGIGIDTPDYLALSGAAGANDWTWYTSGTGTGAPWGAGGMGFNYSPLTGGTGVSAGGFTSNGTFEDSKIKAAHYGCFGGAPTITGGGTISGCDAQGEVVTSTFPVTLTFASAYGSNVSCSLTDDGQPLFWFVSSKSGSGFTLNCSTLAGAGCSGTQFVTYNCAGQGAP